MKQFTRGITNISKMLFHFDIKMRGGGWFCGGDPGFICTFLAEQGSPAADTLHTRDMVQTSNSSINTSMTTLLKHPNMFFLAENGSLGVDLLFNSQN